MDDGHVSDLSKKNLILAAAVACFSESGKATPIARIARRAGVPDSIIYHYFKNKEDLLFHAAGEQVKAMTTGLLKHLAPFEDPWDRLREFMWFQLDYHDTHPTYTNLTIFECRSKVRFFNHEAFDHFRQWARIMTGILKRGVEKGVFRPDLPVALIRDALFGLLDQASIHALTTGGGHPAHPDIPAIMHLVVPMLEAPKAFPTDPDKAQRILTAAQHMFAETGYDQTTMVDIARRAGVAEGTLYEYFRNKEDLLFSSLGNRLAAHGALMRDLERPSPLLLLRQMIGHHFFLYLSEPDFMKVLIFEGIFNKGFYLSTAKTAYRSYVTAFDPVLETGQAAGCIRPDIDSRVFRNLLLGLLSHMTLRWYFRADDTRIDRFSEINGAIDLLMRAVAVQAS
jgi:TetR/AcrR family fatty acid metabolism transcriptional regulator